MIYFLDASALVKRCVKEGGSEDVRRLVRRKARLATSVLTGVEIPSALARRAREGDLPLDGAREHSRRVASDLSETHVVAARPQVLEVATELVWRHPLRAAGPFQLARDAMTGETFLLVRVPDTALAGEPDCGGELNRIVCPLGGTAAVTARGANRSR